MITTLTHASIFMSINNLDYGRGAQPHSAQMINFIYHMEPPELFRQLVYLYVNARRPAYYHPRIRRGRSHAVSSQVEDLFSYFLSINLIGDISYRVDQPLNHGKSQFCPDIALVERCHCQPSIVRHLFDVKTDLGWNRDGLYAFCAQQDEMIRNFQGLELSVTDGTTKERTTVKAAERLQYHVVILSGKNISTDKLSGQLAKVATLDRVHAYVLFPKHHPNYYGPDIEAYIKSVFVNEEDFHKIRSALTTGCSEPASSSAEP